MSFLRTDQITVKQIVDFIETLHEEIDYEIGFDELDNIEDNKIEDIVNNVKNKNSHTLKNLREANYLLGMLGDLDNLYELSQVLESWFEKNYQRSAREDTIKNALTHEYLCKECQWQGNLAFMEIACLIDQGDLVSKVILECPICAGIVEKKEMRNDMKDYFENNQNLEDMTWADLINLYTKLSGCKPKIVSY